MDTAKLTIAKYLWEHREDPRFGDIVRHAQCDSMLKAEIAIVLGNKELLEEQYPNLNQTDTARLKAFLEGGECLERKDFLRLFQVMNKTEAALNLQKDERPVAPELLDFENRHENAKRLIKSAGNAAKQAMLNPRALPNYFNPKDDYVRHRAERFKIDPTGSTDFLFEEVLKIGKISAEVIGQLKKSNTLSCHPLGIEVYQLLDEKQKEELFGVFREQFLLCDKDLVPEAFRKDWLNAQLQDMDELDIPRLVGLQEDSLDLKFALSLWAEIAEYMQLPREKIAAAPLLQVIRESQSYPSALASYFDKRPKEELKHFARYAEAFLKNYPIKLNDALKIVLSRCDDNTLRDAGVNQPGLQELVRFRSLREQLIQTPQTRLSVKQVSENPLLFRIFTVGSEPLHVSAVELDSHTAALQDITFSSASLNGLEFPEGGLVLQPKSSVQYQELLMAPTYEGAPFAVQLTCGDTKVCYYYVQDDLWVETEALKGTPNGLVKEIGFYKGVDPVAVEILNLAKLQDFQLLGNGKAECSADLAHQVLVKVMLHEHKAPTGVKQNCTLIPVETSNFLVRKLTVPQAQYLRQRLVMDASGEELQQSQTPVRFRVACLVSHDSRSWALHTLKEGLLRVTFRLSCGEPVVKAFEGAALASILEQSALNLTIPAHTEAIDAELSFLLGEKKMSCSRSIKMASDPVGQFRCFFDLEAGKCVATLRDLLCKKPLQEEVSVYISTYQHTVETTLFPDSDGRVYVEEPATEYTLKVKARGQSVTYEKKAPTVQFDSSIAVLSAEEVVEYTKANCLSSHVIVKGAGDRDLYRRETKALTPTDILFDEQNDQVVIEGTWPDDSYAVFKRVHQNGKFYYSQHHGVLTAISAKPVEIIAYEKPCAHWSVMVPGSMTYEYLVSFNTSCFQFTGKELTKQPEFDGALALPAPQLAQNPIAIQNASEALMQASRTGGSMLGYGKGFGKAKGRGGKDDGEMMHGDEGIIQTFQRGGDLPLKCRIGLLSNGETTVRIFK